MIEKNKPAFDETNVSLWQTDNLGEGATILVLDEGFEPYKHMAEQVEVMTFGFDGVREPLTGHGSGVMSIIHEVAPKARIIYFPFSSVWKEQRWDMLEWLIDHSEEIDGITLSVVYSERKSREWFDTIKWLNIPFTVASGNDADVGVDGVKSPAKFDYTIAVGAANAKMTSQASYSNGGEHLTCLAPIILAPNETHAEFGRAGTSFAAPYVIGALALYASWKRRNKLPKLTQDEAMELIKLNAKDLREEGHDYPTGYGLFRLPNSIAQLNIELPVVEPPIVEDPIVEPPIIEQPVIQPPIAPPETTWFFTVQKTWDDQQSSIGKFVVMSQAIDFAKLNPGYNVYDATGYLVYKGLPAPIIEEPVVEEPVTEEPIIEEPVVEEPIIEEPIIEEPVVEEPIDEEPIPEPTPDLNLIYKLLLQILEFLKKIFSK